MTDNEIINDFEKEIKYVRENEKYDDFNPIVDIDLCENILDLIHRKNAEIERLNTDIKTLENVIENSFLKKSGLDINIFAEIQSEAIKEFAKRFAKALSEFDMSSVGLPDYDRGYKDCMTAIEDTIDNIVNKMT